MNNGVGKITSHKIPKINSSLTHSVRVSFEVFQGRVHSQPLWHRDSGNYRKFALFELIRLATKVAEPGSNRLGEPITVRLSHPFISL
jgi:hypothetical protein